MILTNVTKLLLDVLNECYNELIIHKVDLKGTVLKPNMIIPGSKCSKKAEAK